MPVERYVYVYKANLLS